MPISEIERAWLNALARRGPPMSDLGPAVVQQILELLETAQTASPDVLESILENEDHEAQSLDHLQKRGFYELRLKELHNSLVHPTGTAELSIEEYNRWVETGYTCIPWLVQELEGTFRQGLRLVLFLSEVEAGKALDWKQHRQRVRFLPETMDAVAKVFDSDTPLHKLVAPLLTGERTRLIRNASAHNDWALFHAGEPTPRIAFFDDNRPKVFTMPLGHILRFFGLILEINLFLSAALHLVYSRLRSEDPHDPGTHAESLQGDPRFWAGTLVPGPRRVAANALLLANAIINFDDSILEPDARQILEASRNRLQQALIQGDDSNVAETLGLLLKELKAHSNIFLTMAARTPAPSRHKGGARPDAH